MNKAGKPIILGVAAIVVVVAAVILMTGSSITGQVARPFPPPGIDVMQVEGHVVLAGSALPIKVQGLVIVKRDPPIPAPRTIPTEIIQMELVGSHPQIGPIRIRAGTTFGLPPSTGRITPITPTKDFPAESFFDVFIEIEIQGIPLTNVEPFRVEGVVNKIPQTGTHHDASPPIQLFNPEFIPEVKVKQLQLHFK